jgi:pimeloyl-ACP methyl ester carboxylesterase
MGGLVGMMLASYPDSPIRKLVLNDVGCRVPGDFLRELAKWTPKDPDFDTLDEVEGYMRTVYAGFGNLTDEQWRHLAQHGHRHKINGKLGMAFDPLIAKGLTEPFADVDMTPFWLQVKCPVLLLRGENSKALTRDIAAETQKTGPGAQLVEIPGVGHAPALMTREQTAVIATWLETGQVRRLPVGSVRGTV